MLIIDVWQYLKLNDFVKLGRVMQIRVLGCSGGIAKGLRTTSFLINGEILVDAGTGVGELSLEEMLAIRHVIITHAHLDHVTGLALMLASIYDDMPPPITIYAPAPVLLVLKISLFNWQLWPDFSELPDDTSPLLQFRALEEQCITNIDSNISVQPVILSHTVESFAYIIRDKHSIICICGDTGPTEKLWQTINAIGGIDHLFIEASYSNDNDVLALQSGHYTPALLAADLKKLEQKPTIHIHHMKPGCEKIVTQQCKDAMHAFKLNIVTREQLLDFNLDKD